MRFTKLFVWPAALLLLPLIVGGTKDQDLAQLQGEWAMQSGTADGFDMPAAMTSTARRICKGDELTVMIGGRLIMKAKITLDPSKKPSQINYQVVEGDTQGKTHQGIYEFDGDTYKSCFAAPGEDRPTDFTSKSGDHRTLSTWKKVKGEGK